MTDPMKAFQDFLSKCAASPELKQKLMVDPTATMKAAGFEIAEGVQFKVTELDAGQLKVEAINPAGDLTDEMLEGVAGGKFSINDLLTQGGTKLPASNGI